MTLVAILFLILSIGCYSISQLVQHKKFKWSDDKKPFAFFGEKQDKRKYKWHDDDPEVLIYAKKNWYTSFFKIKYQEAFPLSATLLVAVTDGYHACQALMFLFLSLSVAMALNFSWWLLFGVWSLIHLIHFATYKFLHK